MGTRKEWQEIERLGGGGQSNVFLVRRPERSSERERCLDVIRTAIDGDRRAELANAIWTYARPDVNSELGALKVFKISPLKVGAGVPAPGTREHEAARRLENEISALAEGRHGLPALLDSNLGERWLVTEFFPEGTIEKKPERYKGDAFRALTAFRSLVRTAAALHDEKIVHRDIKPANVFVRRDDDLVLGDFGIVFVPDEAMRLTKPEERVGPRDYLPQWGDLGERLEDVQPNFDVYMLGKLLWCMVSGRKKLPREYQRQREFNLAQTFPGDPSMAMINAILDLCVVENESKCLPTAGELLKVVDHHLAILQRGGQLLSDDVARPCQICGEGTYIADPNYLIGQSLFDTQTRRGGAFYVEYYICDKCGHLEMFRTKKRM